MANNLYHWLPTHGSRHIQFVVAFPEILEVWNVILSDLTKRWGWAGFSLCCPEHDAELSNNRFEKLLDLVLKVLWSVHSLLEIHAKCFPVLHQMTLARRGDIFSVKSTFCLLAKHDPLRLCRCLLQSSNSNSNLTNRFALVQ